MDYIGLQVNYLGLKVDYLRLKANKIVLDWISRITSGSPRAISVLPGITSGLTVIKWIIWY